MPNSQDVRISNLPDTDSGSKQRVAFDLMLRIANAEHGYGKSSPTEPRNYYITLYRECRQAVY